MEKHDLLIIATCCREWPVYGFMGWGRCGYCQQRPVHTPGRTVADYMRDREAQR